MPPPEPHPPAPPSVTDVVFQGLTRAAGVGILALVAALVGVLFWDAWPALSHAGEYRMFTSADWVPKPPGGGTPTYGVLAFVWGTTVTAVIAMLIAVPLGVASAAYMSEIASPGVRRVGMFLIELLAAIPSVVYGFWGLFFLAPVIQAGFNTVGGPNTGGNGILAAGIILAIMVLPYITAISYDVCQAVPRSQREGSLALGATRWQTIWRVVLPYARPGIVAASFLALGRALGETMAVTMLIGNQAVMPTNLGEITPFALGDSIASKIANSLNEADSRDFRSALVALALVLLVVTAAFNILARLFLARLTGPRVRGQRSEVRGQRTERERTEDRGQRTERERTEDRGQRTERERTEDRGQRTERERTEDRGQRTETGEQESVDQGMSASAQPGRSPDSALSSVLCPLSSGPPVGSRAVFWNRVMTWVLAGSLALTVVPLFLILGYIAARGAAAVETTLFTEDAHRPNLTNEQFAQFRAWQRDEAEYPRNDLGRPVYRSGLGHAMLGSAMIVGAATLLAVPFGLLAAVYLAEARRSRLAAAVRFVTELLGGVPSIVIGIFAYACFVSPFWYPTNFGFNGWAGAFALAVMMIPVVVRSAEESMKLVPESIRQASYALGASRAQTTLRVVLPAALPAIVTGVFLAVGRIAGETAPLLLTAGGHVAWRTSLAGQTPFLPGYIYTYSRSPYQDLQDQAWGGAVVLLAVVMLLNVGIRLLAGKRVVAAARVD